MAGLSLIAALNMSRAAGAGAIKGNVAMSLPPPHVAACPKKVDRDAGAITGVIRAARIVEPVAFANRGHGIVAAVHLLTAAAADDLGYQDERALAVRLCGAKVTNESWVATIEFTNGAASGSTTSSAPSTGTLFLARSGGIWHVWYEPIRA
jgi:hypothetical protein